MNFLAIDQASADDIVSDRFLQSTDFEPGKALGEWLAGHEQSIKLNPRLHLSSEGGQYCIVSSSTVTGNLLVIDEVSANIFADKEGSDCLLILQKLCRFAVRYWRKLRHNQNERYIPNSSKVAIFPYPISNQTSYRIVIEREPDKKRLDRRSQGAFLLAYRSGTSEGGGPGEEAPLTEFRKALNAVQTLRTLIKATNAALVPTLVIDALRVTALDGATRTPLPPEQGFDRWLTLVTEKQKAFIRAPLASPHRIEGPAGTGKTLSLIIKCIFLLQDAKRKDIEHSSVFIAHSEATRKSIQDIFDANDSEGFSHCDRYTSKQSLKITTLQELCATLLNTDISQNEFLDSDAMESKNTQLLYVNEAVREVMQLDFDTHKHFLSDVFSRFLTSTDDWTLSQMVQHEISVLIKGRAEEVLEKYRRLPFLNYGLPLKNDADRGFVFIIFRNYQEKLRASAQFDTDDIVLTATGQLNTPIWRRRREKEGYDSLFIDETHLFNMNELSLFHYLTRDEVHYPIAYSVDRSQSVGDRGWNDETLDSIFSEKGYEENITAMQSVFRSSPEIVNLAFSITSAGATLFTNFEDPLKLATSAFTEAEERRSLPPTYYSFANDDLMIDGAFAHAEQMMRTLEGSRSSVLIVAFDPIILGALVKTAAKINKPIEVIKQRGDMDVVRRAERSGRFVVGLADFVGGLEFDGVILVGVDGGRMPPTRDHATSESSNYLNYASHNRLYVAITRARYQVEILGTKERGPSRLLNSAFEMGALTQA